MVGKRLVWPLPCTGHTEARWERDLPKAAWGSANDIGRCQGSGFSGEEMGLAEGLQGPSLPSRWEPGAEQAGGCAAGLMGLVGGPGACRAASG